MIKINMLLYYCESSYEGSGLYVRSNERNGSGL